MKRPPSAIALTVTLCMILMTIGCAGTVHHAVAVIRPTQGNQTKGIITFAEQDGQVIVAAQIQGLSPDARHAIHIHEFGDARQSSGKSAGSHYNPEGHAHALPDTTARHAGDLGNLQSDSDGNATYQLTVNNISINGPKNPILGRSVIIHKKVDDGGQPTGNAGARIAIGVIGIAKLN